MKLHRLIVLACLVSLLVSACTTTNSLNEAVAVVGTFNIEWLGDGEEDKMPRTDAEYLLIADIIAKTGADVLAVEEIENQNAMQKVLRYLDGYSGAVSTNGGKQRVGVVYRRGVDVRVVGDYSALQLDRPSRLRPGLLLECSKGNFRWLQLCVHLKSTSRYDSTPALMEESRTLRTRQVSIIKAFVDSVLKSGKDSNLIVTGDFNDYPGRKSNPTLDALLDGTLVFVTQGLKSCANPRWFTIDHIAVSPRLASKVVSGTMRIENQHDYLSATDAEQVSDHCPVVVAFNCTP